MKLFLASEAEHPESLEKLNTYVDGFKGKTIAYIPTAANGEGYGCWKVDGTWKLKNTLEADISVIELEDYRNSDLLNALRGKNIIWIEGGACGYLMYWIKRTNFDVYLPELLNSGTIYVGSSAGSMITAPTLDVAERYIGEEERGAGYLPGLNLVDFDFYPHYEDTQFEQIKSKYSGEKMYLVKNGEAIIVEDEKVKVLCEERLLENL